MTFGDEKYDPYASRSSSDLKPPAVIEKTQFGAISRPFLRIENFLIPITRVTEIGYLAKGRIFKVGNAIYFGQHSAITDAKEKETVVEEEVTSVLVVNYINVIDQQDFVRLIGQNADNLWNYLTTNLSNPL